MLRIYFKKSPSDPVSDCTHLAIGSTTDSTRFDVEVLRLADNFQGLEKLILEGEGREILLIGATVDIDLAGTSCHGHACDRCLATSCCGEILAAHTCFLLRGKGIGEEGITG